MLDAGGRVAARFGPWSRPATTAPEVLASVLSTNLGRAGIICVVACALVGHAGGMSQDLSIVELDVEDPAAVDAAFTIGNEAIIADLPDFPPTCREEHVVRIRVPMPSSERHTFLAYRGAEPVGLVQVDLPVHDNLDKSILDVLVLKQHRRQGVGRALYQHAVDFGLARGRTSVMGFSVITDRDGAPTGSSGPFAAALGLDNKLLDVRRRLDLSTVDDAELDRLLAESWPKAAGYSTVQWGNLPPEELLADLALLDSSFVDEMPTGELDYEPEKVDADRLRRTYEIRARYGARPYRDRHHPRGVRPRRRVERDAGVEDRRLARVAADHAGPSRASGAPARDDRQGGQPADHARAGAGGADDRHVQRRGQRTHDRDQRGDGVPRRGPLGELAGVSRVSGPRTWRGRSNRAGRGCARAWRTRPAAPGTAPAAAATPAG